MNYYDYRQILNQIYNRLGDILNVLQTSEVPGDVATLTFDFSVILKLVKWILIIVLVLNLTKLTRAK